MRLQAKRPVRVGTRMLGGPSVLTCVPLVARDRDTLFDHAIRVGAMRPDAIEWRADYYEDLDPADVPGLVRDLAAASACPLLVTNRLHSEGGHAAQDEARRVAVLEAAARSGAPAMVDVEMMTEAGAAGRVIDAARGAGVAVVRSWHDVAGTPSQQAVLGCLRAMQESLADVAKVATTAVGPEDALLLMSAGLEARRMFLEIPCILMVMGPLGVVSRFGGYFGSDLTFAVGVEASAPGQIDLVLAKRVLAAMGLRGSGG